MASYLPATIDSVSIDIAEKPIWILSSYGPGKNPPCQLIDGRDISFEEARMMAYQSQAEGNPAAYVCLCHCCCPPMLILSSHRSKSGSDSTPKLKPSCETS